MHRLRGLLAGGLVCCLFSLCSGRAAAAVFCVTNPDELRAALAVAESNGQSDSIRLQLGAYPKRPPGQPPGQVAAPFQYTSAESLDLSGGWIGEVGTCSGQDSNPGLTVIQTQEDGTGLSLRLTGSNTVSLSNLSVVGGGFGDQRPEDSAAGLYLEIAGGASGTLNVERVRVSESYGRFFQGAVGLRAVVFGGMLQIRNSMFLSNVQNHPSAGAGAAGVLVQGGQVYINHNSFVGNETVSPFGGSSSPSAGALYVLHTAGQVGISNNLFSGNGVAAFSLDRREHNVSLHTTSGSPVFVINSNLLGSVPQAAFAPGSFISIAGNFVADPQLASAYIPTPQPDSPLIDSGFNAAQGGIGSLDYFGRPRFAGAAVDRGAIEFQAQLLIDGFEDL